MRGVITCLVVVFLALVIVVSGNVIWQHLYCGTPLEQCNSIQVEPCEPIPSVEAQRREYQQLAELHGRSE